MGELSCCESWMAERTDGQKVVEALSLSISPSLSVSFSLSLFVYTYLSVCLSFCLPICLSVYLCIYMPSLSSYQSFKQPINQ